jgi:biotin-(acetyl-CoA carboxylase) ligase
LAEQTGSTNDEAARWAASPRLDLALVVADEQLPGVDARDGGGSPRPAALAFSLVLRPQPGAAMLPEMLCV